MKRTAFIIMLAMTIIGGIFTSCNKEKDNKPAEKEYVVTYKLQDYTIIQDTIYLSKCFTYDFTYTDADGNAVEVKGAKAGWEKEIKVKAPFTAKMEGKIKYNEADLPDENIIFSNTLANISRTGYFSSGMSFTPFSTKEKFLEYINKHPDRLNFSATMEIKVE